MLIGEPIELEGQIWYDCIILSHAGGRVCQISTLTPENEFSPCVLLSDDLFAAHVSAIP